MPRLIKRYGSRKLYDTTESRYVSLDEVAAFVREGEEVHVVENKTGEDVTTAVLTQIISEEGRKGTGALSTGFLHDLGKVLHLFGEPQWAVVGDTFPVGCAFSDRIVWPELFDANPDTRVPEFSTRLGIYAEGCGLDRVHLSWGHDEYLFHVLRDHLPEESLYVIRYHSFYAQHREHAYDFLLDERDRRLMEVVREFNPHDLYSKSATRPDLAALRPYYEDLVARFLPDTLLW